MFQLIIKKLNAVFHIDFLYLIRGGSVLGVGHILGVLAGFSLSLLFANFIKAETYGQYKYILSIAGILGAFTLNGVATTIMQSVAKGYEGTLRVEQKSYLKWSTLSIASSLVVGGYYVYKNDWIIGMGIITATTLSYIYNSLILHSAFLSAKKDFFRLSVNQTLNNLILLCGMVSAIYLELNTALWIIVIYYGSQIIFQSFAYQNTLRKYRPNQIIDTDDKNLSKHLSFGNAITYVAEYLDKILIFQFFGPYQVALYAFSVGVPDQIRGVNKLMNTLVVPKLSTKNVVELQRSISTHTKKYVLVSLVVVISFYFLSPYLFKYFFPVYIGAEKYASLYMLILPITAMCTMHGYALQIKKDIKSLYIIKTVDSLGKILLYVVFIPWLGVLGAIIATLISKFSTSLLQILLYHYNAKKKSTL